MRGELERIVQLLAEASSLLNDNHGDEACACLTQAADALEIINLMMTPTPFAGLLPESATAAVQVEPAMAAETPPPPLTIAAAA